LRTHVLSQRSTPAPRAWREHAPGLASFVREHLLLFPLGVLVAMAWIAVDEEAYYDVAYAWRFFVNDIAMVLFFALVAKEVVEATAPGGVLHSWRRAVMPGIAAVGATVASVLVYLAFIEAVDEPMLRRGWSVPIAIDVALAYAVGRAIFGRHAIVPFLLLLALAADALGFVVLAVFHPAREANLIVGAMLAILAAGLVATLRLARVRSVWPYVLGGGVLSWLALFFSGFHPAFALLPVMPFLPHAPRDPGFFVDAPTDAGDALNRFEIWARYPAQLALFLFALVNAGVPLRGLEAGTWALPVAALVGKPLGVMAATGLAVLAGLHLPPRVGWRELLVAGLIVASGFTVALFFATATMAPGQMLRETKMGVLVGLVAIGAALAAARGLHVGRFAR
jgi:Na+:H+ antiporter, NhaA family